jgi:hypothetical protein
VQAAQVHPRPEPRLPIAASAFGPPAEKFASGPFGPHVRRDGERPVGCERLKRRQSTCCQRWPGEMHYRTLLGVKWSKRVCRPRSGHDSVVGPVDQSAPWSKGRRAALCSGQTPTCHRAKTGGRSTHDRIIRHLGSNQSLSPPTQRSQVRILSPLPAEMALGEFSGGHFHAGCERICEA